MYADCRIYLSTVTAETKALLNSTITAFFAENSSRNLGGGGGPRSMMVYEVQDMLCLSLDAVLDDDKRKLNGVFAEMANREVFPIFKELGINPEQPIRSQQPNPLPDRKALDDVVFDILSLTQEERDEVYWAVCELVRNRLEKAKSV